MGSFSVLNNISSANGQQKLNINNLNLSRTLQRLASGKRIHSGADDAAGLQIADSLRGNVYALNQAMRNAADGIGFCQIADGALSVITDILHRMVTLAEEGVSDIIGAAGNKALDAEFQALQAEIARISRSTNYNGMNILDCDMREYGDTLDVFVGDLSAVSYIPIYIGCIKTQGTTGQSASGNHPNIRLADGDPVYPSGMPRFLATDGVTNYNLLCSGWVGRGPSVIIDGVQYNLGWYDGVTTGSVTTWTIDSTTDTALLPPSYLVSPPNNISPGTTFTVVQTISKVGNQSYQIDFEVYSNSAANASVSLMYHMDPDDISDFFVNGDSLNDTGATYYKNPSSGQNPMPGQVDMFGPDFDIAITVGGHANSPDRLLLGNILNTVNTFDDVNGDPTVGGPYPNDAAYAVIWDNKQVSSSNHLFATTYFGVISPFAGGTGGGGEAKVVMFNMNPDSGFVGVDLLTPEHSLRAINHIRISLNEVSIMRGSIGAGMNRLQAAINVLAVTSMNTLAAESSIRDANIAEEITNMTKFQILAQTGMAALSQANANARSVLSLLT